MEELLQEIHGLFTNSLNRQMSRTQYISNLRTFLDILNPDLLYQQMVGGANTYLQSRFQSTLSDKTYIIIEETLNQLQETGSQLVSVWDALDHYEKYEIWNGVDENEVSGSALFGAAVGAILFPGVGTLIGAMFGQATSYARIESEVEMMTSHYAHGAAQFIELYEKCVIDLILPTVVEDLHHALQQLDAA